MDGRNLSSGQCPVKLKSVTLISVLLKRVVYLACMAYVFIPEDVFVEQLIVFMFESYIPDT
jgi:hypothetical protein